MRKQLAETKHNEVSRLEDKCIVNDKLLTNCLIFFREKLRKMSDANKQHQQELYNKNKQIKRMKLINMWMKKLCSRNQKKIKRKNQKMTTIIQML